MLDSLRTQLRILLRSQRPLDISFCCNIRDMNNGTMIAYCRCERTRKVALMTALLQEAGFSQQEKALKIIAKSLFRELKENGYDSRQIVSVSSELISLVTSDLRINRSAAT